LAKDKVGKYVNTHFVSAFQKVATFQINGNQKQGGNVASYFCTPDGRVLHAVAGPVTADVLLREARWIVDTCKMAQLEAGDEPAALHDFFRAAHAERLRQRHGLDIERLNRHPRLQALDAQGRVHLLLAAAPLAKIEKVYKLVFENILGEKVSTAPVVVSLR
jgi:hypothetical protein